MAAERKMENVIMEDREIQANQDILILLNIDLIASSGCDERSLIAEANMLTFLSASSSANITVVFTSSRVMYSTILLPSGKAGMAPKIV